ncbi:hypothetical protein [Pseudomonas sp. R1-15]
MPTQFVTEAVRRRSAGFTGGVFSTPTSGLSNPPAAKRLGNAIADQ